MPDLAEDTYVPQADHPTVEGWEEFTRAFGEFGGVERRYAHIANLQTRDNGDPESLFSTTGRAIVFNSYSLDLGGFKEEIDPEAVRDAMDAGDADYHLLWDHDTTLVLARNRNGTLKAEIGDEGVDFWGRVAKTSYAADLRVLMDRGDVDECSFAFTIDPDGGEEWRLEDDGTIVRRVTKIKRLWDLTICARGAYPSTHSASVRSFAAGLARERAGDTAETAETDAEDRALKPGLIAWDAEQGYCDVACDLSEALQRADGEVYTYWWVIDLNVRDGGTEAIVCRSEIESYQYYLLQGVTYDDSGEPQLPAAEAGLTAVEEKFVAVTLSQDDEGGEAYEAYTARLAEHRANAVEEIKTRAHRAVDERFERANEVVGPSDEVIDVHEADDDSEDDILCHKPTSNDDENVTAFEDGESGADRDAPEPEERDEDDEPEERDAEEAEAPEPEQDEERKLAVARARAKGRAALA